MLSLAQLKVRQTGMTATDMVTISGENPDSSAALVYEDKFKSDSELVKQSRAFEDGSKDSQVFKPALASRYVMDMAEPLTIVEATATYRATDCEWALATPDRFVFRGADGAKRAAAGAIANYLLECRLVGTQAADSWQLDSDYDENALPSCVYTKVQWQMRVLGYGRCDVAALLQGTTFRRFQVTRDVEFTEALQSIADDFWNNNVLARRLPDPDGTHGYSSHLTRRFPNRSVSKMSPPKEASQMIQRWSMYQTMEKNAAAAKNQVLQSLQLAAGSSGGFDGDFFKVTCFSRPGSLNLRKLIEGEGLSTATLNKYRKPPETSVRVTIAKTEKGKI